MAQTPIAARPISWTSLVSPIAGAPMSVRQIETRTAKRASGEVRKELRESEVYRDAAGRMRRETKVQGPVDGEFLFIVEIVDPIEGFVAMLDVPSKIAHCLRVAKGGPSHLGLGSVTAAPVSGPGRNTRTERLGRRVIEDINFEGSRTTVMSDDGSPTGTDERWISAELGLTGSIELSDLNQAYSAKIQSVNRRKPDATLFSIPAGYSILQVN